MSVIFIMRPLIHLTWRGISVLWSFSNETCHSLRRVSVKSWKRFQDQWSKELCECDISLVIRGICESCQRDEMKWLSVPEVIGEGHQNCVFQNIINIFFISWGNSTKLLFELVYVWMLYVGVIHFDGVTSSLLFSGATKPGSLAWW